jgi:hypothetical protein
MKHKIHDVGVANQMGSYSDAIETAPNLRCDHYGRSSPGCSPLEEHAGSGAVRRVPLEQDGGGWRGPTALDSPYRKQKWAAMSDLR